MQDLQLLWRDRKTKLVSHVSRTILKHRVHVHTNADDDDDDADDDDDDYDDVMMMMMMMMTLMKLVNSATKFRHGMHKFYQPNSGLRGSKSRDEAIYTTVLQWG